MELFSPSLKNKKNPSQKYLKDYNISYIFSKESFSYVFGNGTLQLLRLVSKNKKSLP